jgi:hypothetical protein
MQLLGRLLNSISFELITTPPTIIKQASKQARATLQLAAPFPASASIESPDTP